MLSVLATKDHTAVGFSVCGAEDQSLQGLCFDLWEAAARQSDDNFAMEFNQASGQVTILQNVSDGTIRGVTGTLDAEAMGSLRHVLLDKSGDIKHILEGDTYYVWDSSHDFSELISVPIDNFESIK